MTRWDLSAGPAFPLQRIDKTGMGRVEEGAGVGVDGDGWQQWA